MCCVLGEPEFGGSLESGGRFCVYAFGRNFVSVALKVSSYLIHYVKKFYKLCTFNAICKDDAAINCITVHHETFSFPSNFNGSYCASGLLQVLKCVHCIVFGAG